MPNQNMPGSRWWDTLQTRKDWDSWSWEQWCRHLRQLGRRSLENEVRLVLTLMALENRPHVWEKWRGVGFAKLISHKDHLALPISPVRYDTVKQAICALGVERVLEIGIPAASWAAKLTDSSQQRRYLEAVYEWRERFHRVPSASAARVLAQRVVPESVPPVIREDWPAKLAQAKVRIAELEHLVAEQQARIGELVAENRRLRRALRRQMPQTEEGSVQV
jgi:hypothetical protein